MNTIWIIAQESGFAEELGLYALPLIGSVMLTYAIFSLVKDLRKVETTKVTDRLRERIGPGNDIGAEVMAKGSILRARRDAGGVRGALSKMGLISALQRMLDQADVHWNAATFLMNLVGLASLSFIGCYFLQLDTWICLTASSVLLVGPLAAIFVKRKIRLNRFMNQLPDVFELMSQALRAGHSLANAVLVISQQLPDPVRSEFARVFHEQNLGLKIEDAMQNMAKRVGLMDVSFFVTAVVIQRQTGGDLAEILDNISGVIRERIKLFGMVKALTAEGRLSGWVLLALPIVVFILELFINPDYANKLLDTETGQYMLIAGGVAQLLGLAMIQKIVNIKV